MSLDLNSIEIPDFEDSPSLLPNFNQQSSSSFGGASHTRQSSSSSFSFAPAQTNLDLLSSINHSNGLRNKLPQNQFLRTSPRPSSQLPLPLPPPTSFVSQQFDNDVPAPVDKALTIIEDKFSVKADSKINETVGRSYQGHEIEFKTTMGPGVDPGLDSLIDSLAQMARSHPAKVIQLLLKWRKNQDDLVDREGIQISIASSANPLNSKALADSLTDRKKIASIYLLGRCLFVILDGISSQSLGEQIGAQIEDTMFNVIRNISPTQVQRSLNRQNNLELFAKILGKLSKLRFIQVTDRFRYELNIIMTGVIPKEIEPKIEQMILSMRFISLRTFPEEAFMESSDFLEELAGLFEAAHGYRIKIALAETIVNILSPVLDTASAEVNSPSWSKPLERIHEKAMQMLQKPRYWKPAASLACVTIAAGNQDHLLNNFATCVDFCSSKYKERGSRVSAFYGILQLLWVYLQRIQESSQAFTKRLEPLIRASFPYSRAGVFPAEVHLDYIALIPHYLATKQFTTGSELILSLLPQSNERLEQNPPERSTVAIRALLLTLNIMEKGLEPELPSVFSNLTISSPNIPNADPLPPILINRQAVRSLVEKASAAIFRIAIALDNALDSFNVFEDRYLVINGQSPFFQVKEEVMMYHSRRHGQFTVIYPKERQPAFDLLKNVFTSWPRCLINQVDEVQAIDILLRGLVHLDPEVGLAARHALERIARAGKAKMVAEAFTRFIGQPEFAFREITVLQQASVQKLEKMVKIWTDMLTIWVENKNFVKKDEIPSHRRPFGNLDEPTTIDDPFHNDKLSAPRTLIEIEATALAFLTSPSAPLRRSAITALRLSSNLDDKDSGSEGEPIRMIRVLESCSALIDDADEEVFSANERTRLPKWKRAKRPDVLIRLIENDNPADYNLWLTLFGPFLQLCLPSCPPQLSIARSIFVGRFSKIQPIASAAAGLATGRGVNGTIGKNQNASESPFMVDSWRACLIALCSIHFPTSPSLGGDTGAVGSQEIIGKIMPFLVSENPTLRDAVVRSLGCIHPVLYQTLLTALQSIVTHLSDDRSGMGNTAGRAQTPKRGQRHIRLRTAITKAQELTSPLISRSDFPISDTSFNLVSEWLRESFQYLREKEVPEDPSTPILRRGFCIVLRAVIESPFTKNRLPRWISHDTKTLFSVLETWCFRPASGQVGKNGRYDSPQPNGRNLLSASPSFNGEISLPAVMAIAALANIEFIKGDVNVRNFELSDMLRWALTIFEYQSSRAHAYTRQAVRGCLLDSISSSQFIETVVSHTFAETDTLALGQTVFAVLSDLILEGKIPQARDSPSLTALVIYKLGHADVSTRYRALEIISSFFPMESRKGLLDACQSGLHTSFAGVASSVQLRISSTLTAHLSRQAYGVATEYAIRAQGGIGRPRSMLRLLPAWLSVLDLVPDLDKGTPIQSDPLLIKLFQLTVKFGDNCYAEIREIWQSLVSPDSPKLNQAAITKFIVDETTRRGTVEFLRGARKIIASLSFTDDAVKLLRDLAELVDPAGMIAPADSSDGVNPSLFPPSSSRRTALDAQFPPVQRRSMLSVAQAAILLAVDALVQQAHVSEPYMPLFLHAILMHVDHSVPFLKIQARDSLLYYLMVLKRSLAINQNSPSETTTMDISWKWRKFWEHEESPSPRTAKKIPSNMEIFMQDVTSLLLPRYPDIGRIWGDIAIDWAVSCPARHIACRSLQAFRLLSTPLDLRMMIPIVARLSTTAGDSNTEIQAFAREALYTISSSIRLIGTDHVEAWPQIFWTGYAFLESPVELEFLEACTILQDIQEKLDPCDAEVDEALANARPTEWTDVSANSIVRYALVKGLRSASVYKVAWGTVRTMLKNHIRAGSQALAGSLYLLYPASIPWAMQALEDGTTGDEMQSLALNLSALAEGEGLSGISRIMTSFAKGRFRSKDDFVRQSVSCMREYFSDDLGAILHLYLGFLNNPLSWLRSRTLALLKILCQLVDLTTIDTVPYGAEFLAPLVRLTTTDLASSAIDVLEDRLPVAPPVSPGMTGKVRSAWGIPSDSGWCASSFDESTTLLRKKLKEALDNFPTVGFDSLAPSPVEFAVEDYEDGKQPSENKTQSDFGGSSHLGEMVSTLHDLSAFFDDNETSEQSHRFSQGLGPARAVAQLLSKRLRKRSYDMRNLEQYGAKLQSFREEPPIDEGDEDESQEGHYHGSDSDSDWDERESTEVGHDTLEEMDHKVSNQWIQEQSYQMSQETEDDEGTDGGRFTSFRFRRR